MPCRRVSMAPPQSGTLRSSGFINNIAGDGETYSEPRVNRLAKNPA